MAKRYGSFTPRRRAALRKAQLASAAARKRGRKAIVKNPKRAQKVMLVGVGTVLGVAVGGQTVRHKYRTSKLDKSMRNYNSAAGRVKYGMH